MFYHLILGLLRDGRARHGYDLILEYRTRSGQPINPGNFYRECNKLVSQGLIAPDANPPEADTRRIPYRITKSGCRDFDGWLLEPQASDAGLGNWVMFADMLLPTDRLRLFDQMHERLWLDSKTVSAARERAISRGRRLPAPSYHPSVFLMLRRIKHIAADLEVLQELRRALEGVSPGSVTVTAKPTHGDAASKEDGAIANAPSSIHNRRV